jgi:diguanylate cyclase (GGDEF)-like protein
VASTARLDEPRRRREDPALGIGAARPEPEDKAILHHLVEFLDAFMWQANPETLEITFVTKSVRDLLGHRMSSWIGGPEAWTRIIHADDRERVIEVLRDVASDGRDREVEFRAIASDGRSLVLRHAVRLVTPPSGAGELWGITTDVTEGNETSEILRETQERYRELSAEADEFRLRALTDPLTGLPSRILFEDRLATALRHAGRESDPCSVLLMDLDRFKEINDTWGHQVGDIVLKSVALRFRFCLRAQDTPTRLGGDEFAAVLPSTDTTGAERVAERIVRELAEPVEIGDTRIEAAVSIGIATFPAHGVDAESLLSRADVAMYRAKKNGGGATVAEVGEVMPVRPRRKLRSLRHLVIGFAAGLAMLAVAAIPVARHEAPSRTSAARLTAAATALQGASTERAREVVAAVQRTLDELSLNDVSRRDVVAALKGLERTLRELEPALRRALGSHVTELLATIHAAEQAAKLSPTTLPASSVPSMLPNPSPALTPLSTPDPVPAANANPTVPIQKLP